MCKETRLRKKVLVAMSGGVDSSVAAYLLIKQGYDVTGVTMCLGVSDGGGDNTRCCGVEAIEDARKVCRQLGILHFVLNFSNELEAFVIKDFIEEYRKGRTPNPCIQCNRYLKFGKLFSHARSLGFDYIATGHYADIEEKEGGYFLKRPKDKAKDQTYFLYCIKKEQLPFILFPLASLTKNEVRVIAHEAGLVVASKPQSQDICFVSGGRYGDFLRNRGEVFEQGDFIDKNGRFLGRHNGIVNYTVGQRKGLGIALGEPAYVVKIDAKNNRVVLGAKEDLRQERLVAGQVNLLMSEISESLTVRIRYTPKEVRCQAEIQDDRLVICFNEEAYESVTPGQAAVLYHGDVVVGGGVIETG